jgi:hypothetical protein
MRNSLTDFVSLGEDSTSIYAQVTIDVVQGAAREVRLQLHETLSTRSPAQWSPIGKVTAGELIVTFLEPMEQSANFIINGETRLARDGQLNIPLLRLLNSERDTGGVAVEVLGGGEIRT